MRASHVVVLGLIALMLLGGTRTASAQTSEVEALRQEVEALRARLAALEAKVAGVPAPVPAGAEPAAGGAGQTVEVPPGAISAGGAAGALPVYGAASTGSKIFNPDIGMIGNFISATGKSRGGSDAIAPIPVATLQESEASFQAIVDPYARADFFLAIGEEGIEVEEGYVSFPTLPGGLLVKAGKFRANLGRLNAFHNHTLPWIDRPLAMYNLLGGSQLDPDTGIKDAGVSVSRLIPAGSLFVEATGEVFRGDSGTVFKSSRRSDVSTIGRLRAYADFTEQTNIEVGASYGRGHNDLGSDFITQLYAADVTLRWRPLSRAIYRSVVGRTELFWSRREEVTALQRAFGGYASVDNQFKRRWFVGARYDWSDRANNAAVQDRGGSFVLTFWPSEFSQLRSQYRRTRYGDDGRIANELLFQTLFTIGAHGAHAF